MLKIWPNHWLICDPLPKDFRLPCPRGLCHLDPVLLRHGVTPHRLMYLKFDIYLDLTY